MEDVVTERERAEKELEANAQTSEQFDKLVVDLKSRGDERERAAKELEAYAQAEGLLKQAKELLMNAEAFRNLVVETERLQLRMHYEVNRARERLEHAIDGEEGIDRHVAGGALTEKRKENKRP